MKHYKKLYWVGVIILGMAVTIPAANVKKIISKIQNKYKNITTLEIHFKQKTVFELTKMESDVFGTLLLDRKNDRYRLETEDQLIVDNGKTFWRYNKLENQEEKTGKQKQFVIKLTPKNTEESYFKAIKFWVLDKTWEIQRVVYVDINDNKTEFEITQLKINVPIPENAFMFEPPQGVDIVDLRM